MSGARRRARRWRLVWLLLLVGSAGCPSVQARVAIKSCQFNLRGVRIARLTPFEVELEVTVGIYNPNDIDVVLDRLEYTLLIDGRRFADGRTRSRVDIPINQSRDARLRVRANVVDAAWVIQRLRAGGRRVAELRATSFVEVPFGTYPFPVRISRRF